MSNVLWGTVAIIVYVKQMAVSRILPKKAIRGTNEAGAQSKHNYI